MPLQTRVQNLIAFESATPQRTLAQVSSVPTLLRNLTVAVPKSMAALTPQIIPLLATGSDREAVMAADLLQMQLSAPSMPVGMRIDVFNKLLDAAATANEAVRLRIVASLPEMASSAEQLPSSAGGPSRAASTLLERLFDPAAGVRVAAVRGLGELCTTANSEHALGLDDRIESNVRIEMLHGMAGRLRDSVHDVREAVRVLVLVSHSFQRHIGQIPSILKVRIVHIAADMHRMSPVKAPCILSRFVHSYRWHSNLLQAVKAVLPAFSEYVRDAANLHQSSSEAALLDEPSEEVKAVVQLLSDVRLLSACV